MGSRNAVLGSIGRTSCRAPPCKQGFPLLLNQGFDKFVDPLSDRRLQRVNPLPVKIFGWGCAAVLAVISLLMAYFPSARPAPNHGFSNLETTPPSNPDHSCTSTALKEALTPRKAN